MKSRVINTLSAMSQRLPRRTPRLSRMGIALTGAVCVLSLSACYYPYGYYPYGYYPYGYYPYYATVPADAAQREVPAGTNGTTPQAQADAQYSPPAYVVAQPPPPVYVAPAYPAYYPPPVYPAYYGYPGWYGPSLSLGFGYSWGGHGGGRGYHH